MIAALSRNCWPVKASRDWPLMYQQDKIRECNVSSNSKLSLHTSTEYHAQFGLGITCLSFFKALHKQTKGDISVLLLNLRKNRHGIRQERDTQ
jgi:hypothetical protein